MGGTWDPEGEPVGTAAILSGCVMDPWYPDVQEATVEVLRAAGYRVEAPTGQTCCGALAAHEGAAFDASRMARRNVVAFSGFDIVVVDAAGCSAHLKEYGEWAEGGSNLARRVVDVNELVARLVADGSLPVAVESRGEVAVLDPCHLRHAQRLTDEPRAVLRAAGYEPVDLDDAGMCCGAAGTYSFSHAATAQALSDAKADQIRQSGAPIVAAANPGCEMQMSRHLERGTRVAHPIELYREAVLR